MLSTILICAFQVYFLLMNFTVEKFYCEGPLVEGDTRFLMPETHEFSRDNNPLFLERPEWLMKATCIHSWIFPFYYTAVLAAAITNRWDIRPLQMVFLIFIGAKFYALGFYHYMEFTSHVPPQNLVPYFAAEGPYLISIALVLHKIYSAEDAGLTATKTKKI